MKAAGLDEIFSGGDDEQEADFWDQAIAPVRSPSGSEADNDLAAFEQTERPEQRSRKEIYESGIDRAPMPSVAQIREQFNKAKGPVFPKVTAPRKPAVSGQPEVAAEPVQQQAEVGGTEDLSHAEFEQIVEVQGLTEAIAHFCEPKPVIVIVKPERRGDQPTTFSSKEMSLQFNPDQKLLVMIRKEVARYIRLNDVHQIELDYDFEGSPVDDSKGKYPVALHFTTTPRPMVIAVETIKERDYLVQLALFLHSLLKSTNPLKVKG